MQLPFAMCALGLAGALAAAPDAAGVRQPKLYFWIWWNNLEGDWRGFIDFAAEQHMTGVVIWGLQGWRGKGERSREVVRYAHARGVQVIHGLGLNGYEVGQYIVREHPELAAVIPPALADTKKGRWSRKAVFCPSNPESQALLRALLRRAADTGVDGFNFETGDVDYVTCHCPACQARFHNENETEHENKPIGWPLAHLKLAADALAESHPGLQLTCEFAMQRFGQPPYTDCQTILRLNREIDPRITVVWSEATAPPDAIAKKLRAERADIGFYIRSGAIKGWDAERVLSPFDLAPIARRLLALDPVCVMYRSWRPLDRWAVNMGVAARILHRPDMTPAQIAAAEAEFKKQCEPGGKYSFVRRVAPGNLLAPTGDAKLTASSGDPIRLVDGVAEPTRGMWRTERNHPKEAWVVAEFPKPVTVARVRLYHQADAEYRALDYSIQYWADGRWRDVEGMPVRNNPRRGWVEHAFPPVTTRKLRLLITRSCYAARMSLGEWEAYGP